MNKRPTSLAMKANKSYMISPKQLLEEALNNDPLLLKCNKLIIIGLTDESKGGGEYSVFLRKAQLFNTEAITLLEAAKMVELSSLGFIELETDYE